jgi:GTP-binding protein YchF
MSSLGLSIGIIGLPNAGKSTLFNALTKGNASVANYPFTTIDPNVGIAPVPDPRLDAIADIMGIERRIPTRVEFVDIAGLVRGASQGEGLGNQFLGHIRNVDALMMVIRSFRDPQVSHVHQRIVPTEDIEIINLELALSDLATVDRRLEDGKTATKGKKEASGNLSLLERLSRHLGEGQPVRTIELTEEEREAVQPLNLLTDKPMLYLVNMGEDDLTKKERPEGELENRAKAEGAPLIRLCASLEETLSQWPHDEALAYRQELGLQGSGLDKVIQESYRLLDLITFFTTTGGKEVRAWTLRRGWTAEQAAGRIHTDMQQGFIRAEVIRSEDLQSAGSTAAARDRGLMTLEGRGYIVQDGDVIHIRFSPP